MEFGADVENTLPIADCKTFGGGEASKWGCGDISIAGKTRFVTTKPSERYDNMGQHSVATSQQ